MRFNNKIGLKGHFQFFNKKGDLLSPLLGGELSKNLIVDAWLNYYKTLGPSIAISANPAAGANSLFNEIRVGTGSATPDVTDTDLQTHLATSTNVLSKSTSITYDDVTDSFTITHTVSHTFGLGNVLGNCSEVAVFNNTVSSAVKVLFSRSLIKDGEGNPTVIPLTADDELVVTYTLTGVIPRTITGTFTLDVTEYTFEGKMCVPFSSPGAWLNVFNASPCLLFVSSTNFRVRDTDFTFPTATGRLTTSWGTTITQSNLTQITPENPANVRKSRIRFPLNQGNFAAGLKGIAFKHYLYNGSDCETVPWVFKFSPAIPKDNTYLLSFEFATDFTRL